ncbi:DUF2163 domain-containing protein [Sphingomonas psychrotolerans]|uniref:Bacteriophage phiJL001 Gp84 C-terminal domain-containing protein n=1 Tax=Sphingomonas psychrotolerans TaxID=1327635 RepID=A0A2K8ML97_9SPHN|nr:DUF2163 domain-containing protein [Sphingomonas psychrotolerans]ATY33346.1 hypothetical protein CVN68_16390 [Sphingomonas psychrotolerans]
MSWLEGELTSLALCWRIDRRDGVTIGITAHDRDLEIDGLVYRAAPGMTPSAIARSASLDADSMDVTGALTSAAIGETDLLAGRWDGARVMLFATDWRDPGARVPLGEGTIGAVETRGDMLTAELRGVSAALERPVVEETSPECRAALGDRRCRVAMAGRRRFARVIAEVGAVLTLDAAEPIANGYGGGRLRWFGGANSGLEDAVARSEGATVTLRRPPRFAAVGALVAIEQGCDKRLATCAERFANAANFRGEPYLPGIDLLTRYPGA